jgi:NAD-dependent dihydropyrimidine dehydrogenase PreA subunit
MGLLIHERKNWTKSEQVLLAVIQKSNLGGARDRVATNRLQSDNFMTIVNPEECFHCNLVFIAFLHSMQ